MNKLNKLIFSAVTFVNMLCFTAIAQTNVSGGIYANTTWTLTNNPYIVVDTVVVFPNVTLTIEPGVIVKFENDKMLEIRQGSLIALGTITDSITFTSNSSSPTPGSWDKIYLHLSLPSQFNYCNFRYADNAVDNISIPNITTIKNSKFEYNNSGLFSDDYLNYCVVDSSYFTNNDYGINYQSDLKINHCVIKNNQTGIYIGAHGIIKNCIIDSNTVTGIWTYDNDTIKSCEINYNGIGLECGSSDGPNIVTNNIFEYNNIGIKLRWKLDVIYCNKICNNTAYDLYYNVTLYNSSVPNNYWCTTDSAIISSHIYDGYDNISLALISFMPIDTQQCYIITEVPVTEQDNFSFILFPNPVSINLTMKLPINISIAYLKIFNVLGELEYSSMVVRAKTNINVSTLANGIHILEITDGKNISRQKFIVQKNIR